MYVDALANSKEGKGRRNVGTIERKSRAKWTIYPFGHVSVNVP